MPALVYTLCFLTSVLCAVLLLISYARNKSRLLLWSAVSFFFLAVNNFFVLGDLVLFPDLNLLAFRHIASLAAVCTMIYGFIWGVE